MIFGWNLQYGRQRRSVRIDHVTNQLGVVLIDENDVDVIALQETLKAILNLADRRIYSKICGFSSLAISFGHVPNITQTFVDDHEIGVTILVDFANSTQKKTNASVLQDKNAMRSSGTIWRAFQSVLTSSPITEISFPFIAECRAISSLGTWLMNLNGATKTIAAQIKNDEYWKKILLVPAITWLIALPYSYFKVLYYKYFFFIWIYLNIWRI